MNQEPSVLISALSSFLLALFTLLALFGFDIDPEMRTAIVGFVASGVVLLGGVVIRAKVYSPKTVQEFFTPKPGVNAPEV